MSDPQKIYNKYVEKFGYGPKQTNHLIAFAKQIGESIKYGVARKIIAKNSSNKSSNPSKPVIKTKPIIPKMPTIIITKKRKSKPQPAPVSTVKPSPPKPKHNPPASNYSNSNTVKPLSPPKPASGIVSNNKNKSDQKTPVIIDDDQKNSNDNIIIKKTARPIMCRVNFQCSSLNAKKEIYSALKTFVNLQINTPHSDTICYHFTCTDIVKNPLNLEFIELYYDEDAFWSHANHPSFGKAFLNGFKKKNRSSRTFITIGDILSDKLKMTVATLDSTFPKTEAGYLIHNNYLKSLDYTDDTKIMFKFDIISPKSNNVSVIFNLMNKLSSYASESYALMFHTHRMNENEYPNRLELISIWPNSECLFEFFVNNNVVAIIIEFKNLIIRETDSLNRKNHFLCELYGDNIADDLLKMIQNVFDDIGYTQKINTDCGYFIHPKANSMNLT